MIKISMRRTSFLLSAVLGISALCGPLLAPGIARAEGAPVCSASADLTRFDKPLNRTGQRLAAGLPLTIIAIGSSSTAGAFASSSAAAYPARLEVALKERFPLANIKVLNRGNNGEEAADMLARLDMSLAEGPDLILWQVGTNAVLRDHNIDVSGVLIRHGIERMKAYGADVVLIDPQFAPKVLAKPDAQDMVDLIRMTAKAENVDVFHRFDVMRQWHDKSDMSFESFLSPDGLHMNDWSYDCVAKLLSVAISEAATRATAVAGSSAPHL
jgi:acyl-CoA thioesterase-1